MPMLWTWTSFFSRVSWALLLEANTGKCVLGLGVLASLLSADKTMCVRANLNTRV